MSIIRTVAALMILAGGSCLSAAEQRPNILWISCEDISSHLGCYGDTHATTPSLDRLAEEGVRYTHAFTCHGVCAPSRTGIITGMHPISLGANHMRSKAELPDHVQCFPAYLKQAGYYCTNNSKTDYNLVWPMNQVWDESSGRAHWNKRPRPDQPFFSVFNLTMTHESKLWVEGWKTVVRDLPPDLLHRADRMQVPPLYPDTPEVRAAFARLLDVIMVMDQQVGRLLQELDDAGLSENTIVVFWSDHGNGFPRAKRWVYDTGTRVPMIVRIPEKLRTAGQGIPGTVDDQLINLIDLGPTVLNLAGVPVPQHMHGRAFLGPNLTEPREYVHASRDRVDERFDLVRSVRDHRYRYLRNLMPWRPALQHIAYSERSEVRQEMRRLLAAGQLAPESAQFFKAPRAAEELYDVQSDPYELHNLASDPEHRETLERMREECDRWQLDVRDAHLLPESILDAEGNQLGSRWQILHGADGRQRTEKLLRIAQQVSRSGNANAALLRNSVGDPDAAIRWWAITGLTNLPPAATDLELIRKAAADASPAVRIAAAGGLMPAGDYKTASAVLNAALQDPSTFVRHAAILTIDEAGVEAVRSAEAAIRKPDKDEYVGRIAEHALGQLTAPEPEK